MIITLTPFKRELELTTLLSDKVYFRANKITSDNDDNFIMIKGSVNQEDTVILNVYASTFRASKRLKRKLSELQEEIDKSAAVIRRDSSTILSC